MLRNNWKEKVIYAAIVFVAFSLQPVGSWWRELRAATLFIIAGAYAAYTECKGK
jgi:hypothetical protein